MLTYKHKKSRKQQRLYLSVNVTLLYQLQALKARVPASATAQPPSRCTYGISLKLAHFLSYRAHRLGCPYHPPGLTMSVFYG